MALLRWPLSGAGTVRGRAGPTPAPHSPPLLSLLGPLPTRREQRSRCPGGCGPFAHRAPDRGAAGWRQPGSGCTCDIAGTGGRGSPRRRPWLWTEERAASTPGKEESVPRRLVSRRLTSSGSCDGFPPCLLRGRGPCRRSAGHASFLSSMLSCPGGTPGLHQALHTKTSILPWKAQPHLCWGREARRRLCGAPFSPQMPAACRTPRMPQPQPPGPAGTVSLLALPGPGVGGVPSLATLLQSPGGLACSHRAAVLLQGGTRHSYLFFMS